MVPAFPPIDCISSGHVTCQSHGIWSAHCPSYSMEV